MYSSANVESKLLQLCWVRFFHSHLPFFCCNFFLTINQILLVFHTLFWKRWFYILFIRAFNLWWYETTLLFYESVKVKYFNQVGYYCSNCFYSIRYCWRLSEFIKQSSEIWKGIFLNFSFSSISVTCNMTLILLFYWM